MVGSFAANDDPDAAASDDSDSDYDFGFDKDEDWKDANLSEVLELCGIAAHSVPRPLERAFHPS